MLEASLFEQSLYLQKCYNFFFQADIVSCSHIQVGRRIDIMMPSLFLNHILLILVYATHI